MRFALLFLCVLSVSLAACTDGGEDRAPVRQALLADLANRVIEPAHARFATDAAALEAAVADLAADPSETTLDAARMAWTEAARSFHRLSALNLPGVRFGLYHNRILTWPADTARIEEAVATEEEIDLGYVERLGSNVRGLPGLEYLLFADEASTTGDSQRRAYVAAVAEDVSAQADALLEKWSHDGGDELGMFEAADSEGRNLQSSISRIVNEMAMVAEDLRYEKLGRPMGVARDPNEPGGEPRPDLVESPYAEVALALIREDLVGLRALVTADGGTGLDDYLATLDAEVDGQPFGDVLLAQIDATDAAAAAITPSLRDAITSDPETIRVLYDETGDLLRLIKSDLANWLGVSITFSDNDGD